MRKRIVGAVLAAMLCVTQFCGVLTSFAAGTGANRLNVVFVLDASGSMSSTDPSGLRYDALDLFLGLLTDTGNYVGSVLFTQSVEPSYMRDIQEITGPADKDKVYEHLMTVQPTKDSDTNIGLALMAAEDMLDKGKNPNLDSVIILLSDGKTDLKSQSALKESNGYKNDAVARAKANNYQIYCVGLNANGGVDEQELNNIAIPTGGKVDIVKSAEDLAKVSETFYSMIYNTSYDTDEISIGQDGKAVKYFDVENIGVEEVNIDVHGKNDKIELTKPDGSQMPQSEVDNRTRRSRSGMLTSVKVINPEVGQWCVTITGNPGARVTVTLIPNVDLAITAEKLPDQDVYERGTNVKVAATIISKGAAVNDDGIYNSNAAELKVKNTVNGQEQTIPMVVENGRYAATVSLDELATYEGVVTLTSGGITRRSDKLSFHVDNTPPKVLVPLVEDKIVKWPFKKTVKTYDLTQYVTDDNDPVLNLIYTLEKTSFNEGDVTIDNRMMSVSPSVSVDGTATVTVTDSSGASVPVEFAFNVVSVTKLALIIIGIIALIVLGVVAFFTIRVAKRKYRGKIMIQIYDKTTNIGYQRQIHEPYRGKQPLRMLDSSAMDVGLDGVFKPTSTGYIVYESKRAFYCATSPDRSVPMNKLEIALGQSVTISSSEDFLTGANITYM